MIKIISIYAEGCKVAFEVQPIRPCNIKEPKLAEAVAKNSSDYYIDSEDKKTYKFVPNVDLSHPILKLKELQELAQEEFSKKIHKLHVQLEQFKLLQELTKKKEVKK